MSVQFQVDRIKENIADSYARAAAKGAELPEVQNSENLPAAIESIPAGGLPEDVYTISVEADPPEGGIVSGGGVASEGMTVTVDTKENDTDGKVFFFDGWQENGDLLAKERLYTFQVNKNRNLVAKFIESPYAVGIDWWNASLPSSANWCSVAYGDGNFVVISTTNSSKAAYSEDDGATWKAATLPSTAYWNCVAYGDGRFVAVAGNKSSKAAYSEDGGATWKAATLPSSLSWYGVAYGDGRFVAVSGNGSSKAAYSEDGGATWKAATLPSTAYWNCVAYGDGKFVAIAEQSSSSGIGEQYAAYSEDGGVTWKAATLPVARNWRSIAYGNGIFVAIAGTTDIIGIKRVAYSEDGKTWNEADLPYSTNWVCVAFGNGKFFVIAETATVVTYSADGINWEYSTTMPSTPGKRYDLAYGNRTFVAVASGTATIAYSSALGPAA